MPPLYDLEAVRPMWEELEYVGISPLNTPEEVDELMNESQQGTTLLVVNSVCGCAAGSARPGAMLALQNDRIPGRLATVFAGVDTEATEQARSYLKDVPPSSPNIILFKDGLPVLVMQRRHIETMTAMEVARMLKDAFDQHCEAAGPSIPPEEFEKLIPVQDCGSSIPLYGEND